MSSCELNIPIKSSEINAALRSVTRVVTVDGQTVFDLGEIPPDPNKVYAWINRAVRGTCADSAGAGVHFVVTGQTAVYQELEGGIGPLETENSTGQPDIIEFQWFVS